MSSSPTGHARINLAWAVLRALLGLETIGMVALVVVTVAGALRERGDIAQELSLIIMAVLALAWVAITFAGVTKGRPTWARASSLVLHVLLFAGGTGALQLGMGPWWWGFAVVFIAVLGFVAAIVARPSETPVGE